MKKAIFLLLAWLLMASVASAGAEEAVSPANILIAYFTWADNTIVEDADASIQSALEHYSSMGDSASGVDATSSASLLVPGNTAIMASYIHDVVGGDLFSIQVEEPYPDNYDETLDRAADELDDEARPALRSHVEHMEQYEIVFWVCRIGGTPVQWLSRAFWRNMIFPARRSFLLFHTAQAAFPAQCEI